MFLYSYHWRLAFHFKSVISPCHSSVCSSEKIYVGNVQKHKADGQCYHRENGMCYTATSWRKLSTAEHLPKNFNIQKKKKNCTENESHLTCKSVCKIWNLYASCKALLWSGNHLVPFRVIFCDLVKLRCLGTTRLYRMKATVLKAIRKFCSSLNNQAW